MRDLMNHSTDVILTRLWIPGEALAVDESHIAGQPPWAFITLCGGNGAADTGAVWWGADDRPRGTRLPGSKSWLCCSPHE